MRLTGRYINLDRSNDRRIRMEAELDRVGLKNSVSRFAAIEPGSGSGKLTKSEYGCFLSHRSLVDGSEPETHLLVLEDDVKLSIHFREGLRGALQSGKRNSLDIIFLGQTVQFDDVAAHARLLEHRRRLESEAAMKKPRFAMLDGSATYRWGAFGYVLSPEGAEKLRDLLSEIRQPEQIDLLFRRALEEGRLKGGVLFPYVVGIEPSLNSTMSERRGTNQHHWHALNVNNYLSGEPLPDCDEFVAVITQRLIEPRVLRLLQSMYERLVEGSSSSPKQVVHAHHGGRGESA